jgi:hypothetical protein
MPLCIRLERLQRLCHTRAARRASISGSSRMVVRAWACVCHRAYRFDLLKGQQLVRGEAAQDGMQYSLGYRRQLAVGVPVTHVPQNLLQLCAH